MRRVRVYLADDFIQLFAVSDAVHNGQPRQVPHRYCRYRFRRDLLRKHLLRAVYGHDVCPHFLDRHPLALFSAERIAPFFKFEYRHSSVEFSYSHQNAPLRYANSIRRIISSVSVTDTPDLSFDTCRSSYSVAVTMSIAWSIGSGIRSKSASGLRNTSSTNTFAVTISEEMSASSVSSSTRRNSFVSCKLITRPPPLRYAPRLSSVTNGETVALPLYGASGLFQIGLPSTR